MRPSEPTFYAALEPFTDFAEVADPARYVAAPDDWILVLADIKGSTEAARAGRYKDVNLVGAACITATLNVTKGLDLPYVFGGDGATVLIPPAAREAVARRAGADPPAGARPASGSSSGSAWCRSRSSRGAAGGCWSPSTS